MSVLAGSFVSLLASLGSILNLVVLGTLWVRRGKLTPVEICIINMSIAGLIPALVSYPMYASSCFASKWIYGYIACLMDGFIVYFFGMVSIATLTAIAVIRLISTYKTCSGSSVKPLTNGHAVLVVLSTYLYGSIWTIPPFFGWGKYGPEPTELNCAVRWNDLSPSYFITVFVFGYVTPLGVIIVCYVKMSQLMKITAQQAGNFVLKGKVRKGISKKSGAYVTRMLKNRQYRTDQLMFKFGIITCVTFFVTWTPYAIVSFLAYFNLHIFLTKTASLFPSLFAKSSVLVNPIIYFFMVKRFRKEASSWLSSMRMTSMATTSSIERRDSPQELEACLAKQNDVHIDEKGKDMLTTEL